MASPNAVMGRDTHGAYCVAKSDLEFPILVLSLLSAVLADVCRHIQLWSHPCA